MFPVEVVPVPSSVLTDFLLEQRSCIAIRKMFPSFYRKTLDCSSPDFNSELLLSHPVNLWSFLKSCQLNDSLLRSQTHSALRIKSLVAPCHAVTPFSTPSPVRLSSRYLSLSTHYQQGCRRNKDEEHSPAFESLLYRRNNVSK